MACLISGSNRVSTPKVFAFDIPFAWNVLSARSFQVGFSSSFRYQLKHHHLAKAFSDYTIWGSASLPDSLQPIHYLLCTYHYRKEFVFVFVFVLFGSNLSLPIWKQVPGRQVVFVSFLQSRISKPRLKPDWQSAFSNYALHAWMTGYGKGSAS